MNTVTILILISDIIVEKPIKNSEKFFSYISTHFASNRPGTKLKKFR